ncbi:MAG: helix-turn-helix transcriptional regulator [Alphaproteobacteria bacterium]|nr:helix-turn-helix transcriptional regulator [Alphaproteobacteria bacterium]
MILTAAQLRAARGLLDWTRNDLAKAANISPETVKNIEHGTFRPQEQTADAIVRAFASHDVAFTEDEGVRKKKELVRTFQGKEGFIEKLDHVYNVARDGAPITRHLALSDNYAPTVAPEYVKAYADKMRAISGLDARCLIWEGDYNFTFDYCQYRWLKKDHKWVMPFYLYGNYASFMMHTTPDFFMTVSIYSEFLVENLKKQFDLLWAEAIVPTKKKGGPSSK